MQINIHEVFLAEASFHMPVTAIYAFMDYTPKHKNTQTITYLNTILICCITTMQHIDINDSKVINELYSFCFRHTIMNDDCFYLQDIYRSLIGNAAWMSA